MRKPRRRRRRARRWWTASGVRNGRLHQRDLLRDVILERLDREVGHSDGVVRLLPRAPLVRLMGGRLLGDGVIHSSASVKLTALAESILRRQVDEFP